MISNTSRIREDDTCPICLTVLYKPTCLKVCNHIFCGPCIDEAVDMHQLKNCPLCRKQFKNQDKVLLTERQAQLQKMYPNQIKSRIANTKEQKYIKLQIGNTTQVIQTQDSNKYRWTLYVNPVQQKQNLGKYVQKVEVKLHPTFNPPIITFRGNEKIQVKRLGWGTFRIDIKIYWKKPNVGFIQTYHDLQFQPKVSKIVVCKIGQPA